MTKIQFIDFINDSLLQIDKTAKYHPNNIARAIEHAFNNIIFNTFRKDISNIDRYAKTYNSVAVSQDATTMIWYSTLPAPVVQLPAIGDGVREISTTTDVKAEFVPVKLEEYELLDHLESHKIQDDTIPYIVEREIVEYQRDMSHIPTVRMRLIIPFTSYANTDQVYIPSGQDQALIQFIRQFLGSIPLKDLKDDNADITQRQ